MSKNRKDLKFKNECNIEGYSKNHDNALIISKFYHPDCIFVKDKKIVIVESSSTGDRKAHLGELLQFYEQAKQDKQHKYSLILHLCSKCKNPPTKEGEIERLGYYYGSGVFSKEISNIEGLYILDTKDDIKKIDLSKLQNLLSVNMV